MVSVYINAQLVAEKLVQILDEADDNDDRRARHSDEKEVGQEVHSEVDESAHTSILPRSVSLRRLQC